MAEATSCGGVVISEARFLYCTRITRTDMKAGFFRKER